MPQQDMKKFTILLIFFLVSCSFSGAPKITVYNESAETIKNITLLGSGFSEVIPSLEASKKISITVHPPGESGLEIQFDTSRGQFIKNDLAYIEAAGGYKVTIWIKKNFEIYSDSKLGA